MADDKKKKKGFLSRLGFKSKEDKLAEAAAEKAAQQDLVDEQMAARMAAINAAALKSAREQDEEASGKTSNAEEQARIEAEEKRKAEEQARKDVLAAKKLAEEKAALAEEAKRKAEEDAKRLAEEKAAREAEEKRLAEEKAQKEAAEKTAREAQAKADAEAAKLAKAEGKRKAKEEAAAAKLAEKQAKEQAKLEARQKAEDEAKRKAEEKAALEKARREQSEKDAAELEARQNAEADAREKAETEAKAQAEAEAEAARKQAEEVRIAQDALERESAQREKAEAERLETEQAERKIREQAEAEAERVRAEAEKQDAERLAAEQSEALKKAAEEQAREQAEAQAAVEAAEREAEAAAKRAAEAEKAASDLPAPVEEDEITTAPKTGFFSRITKGLKKSTSRMSDNMSAMFNKRKLDDEALEDLQDLLISSDLGVGPAMKVSELLAKDKFDKQVTDLEIKIALADVISEILTPLEQPLTLTDAKPQIMLFVGVNGSGKTTTLGKIAKRYTDKGKKVLIAAGDTFRAAAVEQLTIWGERADAPVISGDLGMDAAGLVYDAIEKAKTENFDILMIDTAGRLQNRTELMDELSKIVRVIKKQDDTAPHHSILVLDATVGQNALVQTEAFRETAGITGLIMTKLDGTAKGGVLVALSDKFKLPIHFIGIGERIEDLENFSAPVFAAALSGVADQVMDDG